MNTVFSTENIGLKTLFTIGFILLLNTLASFFYWYSTIWWFDIFMHFFGGFFVALFSFWISNKPLFKDIQPKNLKSFILAILFSVLFIGLLWEFYEIAVDYMTGALGYVYLDGISDIFNDTAGGCIGCLYLFKDSVDS